MARHNKGICLNTSPLVKLATLRLVLKPTHFAIVMVMLLVTLFTCTPLAAQVKKRTAYTRQTVEEYYDVNKTIRHGQYIKFQSNYSFQNVIEYGSYDKNRKTGVWLTLHPDELNSVESIGVYAKDKREGKWKYFYPYGFRNPKIKVKGIDKKCALLEKSDLKELKILAYDTVGCDLMGSGIYENDLKAGIWNYYSPGKKMIHQYDHTYGRFVKNNDKDTLFIGQTYLGGRTRFMLYFYEGYDQIFDYPFYRNSRVIYEINPPSEKDRYRLVSQDASKTFTQFVQKIIEMIPDNWVVVDASYPKKLRFKVETKRKADGGYEFWLEFI
jgi:hypothetical protein